MSLNNLPALLWEEKYSVGVDIIDKQHQKMFDTINKLVASLAGIPTREQISVIVSELINYKRFHFETEEKLFKEYNYPDTEFHISKHREFNTRLQEIQSKYPDDVITLAYELADFLEDWLINHLLVVDQQYIECFKSHGLK
jgi:hemerythrin-like metal-binding protein